MFCELMDVEPLFLLTILSDFFFFVLILNTVFKGKK